MSFFGSGNNANNNPTSGGFGGFGSSNTGGGFGANNNTSSGGSLFGGNTATSGGFGGGGFGGSNNSNPFGTSKPAFGASTTTTSGGGLFGSNTSTSGTFGGFGSNNNNNATSGFGSSNSGGGLFGQSKPATSGFGSSTTGGSLFGGGTSAGGFGSNNTTSGFGANNNTTNSGFGSNANSGGGFTFGGASSAAGSNNGTAGTPFNAFSEKEGATNATSLYQSITFQQPYQKKSFEELRQEDYSQGRRFGNSNGQAGSFGQSTGFGGFGSNNNTSTTGGGLFGNTNNNTSATGGTGFGGFGSNNNSSTAGGFGSTNTNTGGGLFGASKPAGGLFGSTNQTSGTTTAGFGSTSGSGGGLFGNTSGGFGNNTNDQQSGGLFGNNNNNQQQNKPAFGGFGSTTNNQTTGFGSNNQAGGSLFGNTNNNNNNQQSGTGLFGSSNNQQQNTGFGASNTGGSLFGNTNNKPAGGLFGSTNNTSTNTGGGLFGNTNTNQQSGGGLFGSTANNNSGSLFGNQNQNKPAGTGLFGSSTTGGSLFGNNNNQQQNNNNAFGSSTGGSLFGNQNKPAGTSLFGNNNNNTSNSGSGLSLFGNNTNNQQNNANTSLFGNNNQNQNQQNNNSLFGGSFGANSSQQPQQNQLHASLTGAPYGNEQLFSSLAAPSPPVGPLATPLSGARPAPRKTPSLLASARLNSPSQFTPRGSTIGRGGYGFNYSTYGTPGSAFTAGSLTPGASSLLRPTGSLSSGLTSRLNKSSSMSNLRGDTPSDGRSLLRPSVFSPPGPNGLGSRNMRKLNIDRSLRTDLFPPAQEEKAIEAPKDRETGSSRKVNFERPNEESTTPPANASNALVRTEDSEDSEQSRVLRSGRNKGSEMEQVNGANQALSTVPEDSVPARPSSAPNTQQPAEKSRRSEVGEYWTKPALKDLKKFSRQQLKNVGNFVVGRDGVGSIEFGSVDLSNTLIEDICANIVQLSPRSATVYQDDANKPAMGKALNVPSTIHLEHSWPRSHGGKKAVSARSGPEYDKHIRRLKRVSGTKFQSYNPDTGVWTFTVEHFTTYGLGDDDDTESELLDGSQMQEDSSELSDAPDTPIGQQEVRMEEVETPTGEMDDTFQFKLDRRSQISVPGGFEDEDVSYPRDELSADEDVDDGHQMAGGFGDRGMEDPFTSSGGPVKAPSPGALDRYHSNLIGDAAQDQGEVEDISQEIPGSFVEEPKMPKSILKPTVGLSAFDSPEKLAFETWEEQLQRTLSPKKRDRQALRDMQQSYLRAQKTDDVADSPFKQSMLGQSVLGQSYLAQKSAKKNQQHQPSLLNRSELGQSQAFTSAKDIMDSLWAQEKGGRKTGIAARGFELPYPKRRRLSSSSSDNLRPNDAEWHDNLKPHFTDAKGTIVYGIPGTAVTFDEPFEQTLKPLVGAHKDVRFARLQPPKGTVETANLIAQKDGTEIEVVAGFPVAKVPIVMFYSLSDMSDPTTLAGKRERWIWKMVSILLDPIGAATGSLIQDVPDFQLKELDEQARMDALAVFWAQEIVAGDFEAGARNVKSAEEKALLLLTKNDVAGACDLLAQAGNFKLALLVSQLPGATEHNRQLMRNQIEVWRARNDWSEMSDAVRTLYSILAGQVTEVDGSRAGAAPEDRADAFKITERFGLSWQQAFGLKLFYGGFASVAEAVRAYGESLFDKKEDLMPALRWNDELVTADALIEVLLLLAGSPNPEKFFDPVVLSGSAWDSRLMWQLSTIFNASGKVSIAADDLDRITLDYATEVEADGKFVTAVWVLLHLRDAKVRARAVRELLERNAEEVTHGKGDNDADAVSQTLTDELRIPAEVVHRVRALHAAGNGDAAAQTLSLILAGDVEEAHAVLCTSVGPTAIIEQDYEVLSTLLSSFEGHPHPEGWNRGGGVYADFVRLVEGQGRERNTGSLVQKLRKGLRGMESGERKRTLEERVAVGEMGRVVEEMADNGEVARKAEKTEDANEGGRMLDAYQKAVGVVA